jgi:tripartite-type tricarboxylate transporter receptor subunit TctC
VEAARLAGGGRCRAPGGHPVRERVLLGETSGAALADCAGRRVRWWSRRRALRGLAALVLYTATAAVAGTWPERPIRLVVGYPAGGSADAGARHLAGIVSKALGQQVVVENRPGAAGSVAAASVARAPADGYTVFYGTSDLVIHAALNPKAAYDPQRDFTPVTGIGRRPVLLVAHPSVKARTVKELVALARAQPGALTVESSGVGSIEHLSAEVFQRATGVKLTHVPYKGSAPAILDLLAGQVQLGFEVPLAVVEHVRAGKLAAIVSAGRERLVSLPEVPTVHEAGVPELDLQAPWAGIFVPARTPAAVVARLNAEFVRARNLEETRASPVFLDSVSITGTPEAFSAFVRAEVARWARIARDTGVTVGQ